MKKGFRKLSSFVLAFAMVLGMSSTVFAADFEENGETGVAGNWDTEDTERLQGDTINIKKDIKVYNPNGTTVYSPVVTYSYTVTPATVTSLTITDEDTDHNPNVAVTGPINAGITTGLVVTGTAAGTAGNATSAVGTLVFDNTTTWTSAAAGDINEYNINLDFTNVAFTGPGVYRYQIAETISAASYDVIAMEDGVFNTVYLDVYVDGGLDIYGYVCLTENASVTPATSTKINGFVTGSSDGTDKYYTYDLTLSKDVVNDNYGESNIAYPFTVIFTNTENYTSTFKVVETVGTGSTGISPAVAVPAWSGVAEVKDGGDITITGIPAGVDVEVYETNIASGVTYKVDTSVNGGAAVTDNEVKWGTAPASAVAQAATKADYQSTKANIDTDKNTATDDQSVAITNTLLLISPTGFVVRFAPYMLVLAGGILLIVLGVVLFNRTNKKEA